MSPRSILVILVVVAAIGALTPSAGGAVASTAGAPCRSIDAFYRTSPSPEFVLLFSCSQPINGFTFTPGGTIPGAQLVYGTTVTECYTSQGGGIVNSPVTCTADPAPIPAETTVSVAYPSSETCTSAGIHVLVTVDKASSFTVNGTCAGQGMGVRVKSLTGSAKGYRETLRCGPDGGNCVAITEATDAGPKDKGAQVAYARTLIAAGATKTVTVSLKSFARSLLAKRHSLTAKVLVTGAVAGSAAPTKVLSKTVRITSRR